MDLGRQAAPGAAQPLLGGRRLRRQPPCGTSGVLVGPNDRGVDLDLPVQLPGGVGVALHRLLDPRPGAVGLPAGEPLVAGLPGPIPLGQVPPGRPGPDPPDDAVDHLAMVTPAATPPASLEWQQWPQPLPLRIRKVSTSHGAPLSHQHAIRETRPSSTLLGLAKVLLLGVPVKRYPLS